MIDIRHCLLDRLVIKGAGGGGGVFIKILSKLTL